MEDKKELEVIDLRVVAKKLFGKRKKFFIMWFIVTIFSLLWILPQPRYYICSVSLAPETSNNEMGGLASMASSLGLNLGNKNDAIYPALYPELFESPEFLVSLFSIKVSTIDDRVKNINYSDYLRKQTKKNWLTKPFIDIQKNIVRLFVTPDTVKSSSIGKLNPFNLSKKDFEMLEIIKGNIVCAVDQRTDVVTISVKDQDRLVCALVSDSVRQHLQDFIIKYRTSKVRIDLEHYVNLSDSALAEYNDAVQTYSNFCDANQDIMLQSVMSRREKLENAMQLKYNTYTAMQTQVETMRVRLQEKTPSFTILKSATVPHKPAGPKRLLFLFIMLITSTTIMSAYVLRSEMRNVLVFGGKAN